MKRRWCADCSCTGDHTPPRLFDHRAYLREQNDGNRSRNGNNGGGAPGEQPSNTCSIPYTLYLTRSSTCSILHTVYFMKSITCSSALPTVFINGCPPFVEVLSTGESSCRQKVCGPTVDRLLPSLPSLSRSLPPLSHYHSQ